MIALGSLNQVIIYQIVKDGKPAKEQLFSIDRPSRYLSEKNLETMDGKAPMPDVMPVLSWGYGKTPIFKDRTYILLAIGWGPYI